MSTVVYLRCSSDEQAASKLGIEAQERKCRAYAEMNDLFVSEVICDPGFSGKSLDRPGIQRILDLARKRSISNVVVLRLDRLSRSVRDTLGLVELFKKYHVELHSLQERLDTSSASGKFVLTLLSALAEMERGLISERTSAALQSKILRGERAGEIPFGWRCEDGIRLLPNEQEQEALALIRDLHSKKYSLRSICAELERRGHKPRGQRWHSKSVWSIIRRDAEKRAA